MKKTLKLQTKIMLLVVMVVFISISIVIGFITSWAVENVENKVKTNIMNVAKILAQSPNIKEGLITKDPNKSISSYVENVLKLTEQVEYIIIVDMDEIRYSHPNPQRIGEKFVGGDEYRVLQKGETYISEATGTLGKSLRAFTPIYDKNNNKQIGFVSVGTLTNSIEKAKKSAIEQMAFIALGGLIIGGFSAFLLSQNIKKTLLGLEPEEITKLYNEKMSIIDAIHEGLIAIDSSGNITLINDSALKILQIGDKYKKEDIVGKDVEEFLPTTKLPCVLETGSFEYDKEQRINNTIIMTNRVPIKNKKDIVGAIATFRDKTEITNLAEQLTGVKQIVDGLRANNHEFMNKLHVILGLIHIGELEEAKKYISNITERQQQILSKITNKINDSTIAGLILGKFSRAKELGVSLRIDDSTEIEDTHKNITSSVLVTIIGNLIENAMEAVRKCEKEEKIVYVKLKEYNDKIEIEVKDTGIGIEEENLKRIFERGYTTKSGSEGVGLGLVKETVENLKGQIKVTSKLNEGSAFKVVLFKE